jgi:hypothetical protein
MKKFRGKALATLLSLALIASSLPVTLASASSKTVSGRLADDPDNDEFWLVNGGTSKDERQIEHFENYVYTDGDAPLQTIDREDVDDIEVASISHVSGDRVVKWDIDDDDDDDGDGVTLSLKNSDSEGDEVIAILYKGTYTDDDDNEYTVKASTTVTIHAVDEFSAVIGDGADALNKDFDPSDAEETQFGYDKTSKKVGKGGTGYYYNLDDDDDNDKIDYYEAGLDSPELEEDDDDFALKTTSGEEDSKALTVYVAERFSKDNCLAVWQAVPTVYEGFLNDADDYIDNDTDGKYVYVLSSNNDDDIKLSQTTSDAVDATTDDAIEYVTATVDEEDAGTANVTFTAEVTDVYDEAVADDDDVKAKVKVAKKVLVNDDNSEKYTIAEDDDNNTYIKGDGITVSDKDGNTTTNILEIDGGYEVEFAVTTESAVTVSVSDSADLDSITGDINNGEITIGDASVDEIDLDEGSVTIDDEDAEVGDISTEGDNSNVTITAEVTVGDIDIDGEGKVTIEAGTVGNVTTDGEVEISASDDDTVVSVGTVSAKEITIDSEDGKISVKGIVSSKDADDTDETSITLSGDSVSVDSIDFDYYGTDLKFDDFQGEIPAPVNATADDATLETTNEDDEVTVKGDVEIDTVSFEDDSKMVFEGELSVDSIDGSGTMYIGANKLYVGNDASDVLVKITGSNLQKGDTIFTAESDAVDEDDLEFFGFTVEKVEGSTIDKFVVDEREFAGLALNKTSSKIVLGESETFTASAYAPGTSLPEGYGIAFELEDNGGVFELTDNGNGTATVKVVDYDETFSDENKATLRAYVVDEDGDEDDDYDAAECDLTALKTPEVTWTSDTTDDFTLAPGASYQFKITATEAPVMVAGTAGVLDVTNVGKSGNDYFIKVTAAADAAGKETGLYVNGTKLLVVKVAGAASFTSDTTADVTVKKGASYQYKITASAAPSFTLGTSGVFNYTLVSQSGNNYFYKITAVGAVGSSTGVYVNGQKVNVATVG